jgi:hypothetical protein
MGARPRLAKLDQPRPRLVIVIRIYNDGDLTLPPAAEFPSPASTKTAGRTTRRRGRTTRSNAEPEAPKPGALAGRSVGGPLTPCFRAALLLFVQSESAADVVVRYRFCCSYVKKDLL